MGVMLSQVVFHLLWIVPMCWAWRKSRPSRTTNEAPNTGASVVSKETHQ